MTDITTQPTGFWAKFWDLANPTRFLSIAGWLIPVFALLALIFLVAGLYLGFSAPEDYQQGATVQIMFIHVPASWVAMMCLFPDECIGTGHFGLASSAGRCFHSRSCPDWRGIYLFGTFYRFFMGQTDVGYLVGLGRPTDFRF